MYMLKYNTFKYLPINLWVMTYKPESFNDIPLIMSRLLINNCTRILSSVRAN